jgi:hypothetical protein
MLFIILSTKIASEKGKKPPETSTGREKEKSK